MVTPENTQDLRAHPEGLNVSDSMVFLDRLTATSLLHLFPKAAWNRVRRRGMLRFQYFSSDTRGKRLLMLLESAGWMAGKEADFSYVDVRGADGTLLGPQAQLTDPLSMCHQVRAEVFSRHKTVKRLSDRFDLQRLFLNLEKSLAQELAPVLLRINVVSWFQRQTGAGTPDGAVYLAERSPWHGYIRDYAAGKNVILQGYRKLSWPRGIPWRRILNVGAGVARELIRTPFRGGRRVQDGGEASEVAPLTVAAPSLGQGLTLSQSKNTDLFWVPFAKLRPNQLLVYFTRPDDLLDASKCAELQKSSIRAISMGQAAASGGQVAIWPRPADQHQMLAEVARVRRFVVLALASGIFARGIDRWIAFKLFRFVINYIRWRWFFTSLNIKLHVSRVVQDTVRDPADQAIADLGGLSIGYQLASEAFPYLQRASTVDVRFVFSTTSADAERFSGSDIPQLVANGYVHDHAFSLVRGGAAQLRRQLQKHGAQFVICFFDEGSADDHRWGASHTFRAENYRFLLNKLLEDPAVGLVFKPKNPSSLRRRLGPVRELLEAALATGRCHLYEDGAVGTEVLPCEASLSSDVAIGILSGSTAAMEGALAGTPALLIDRESMTNHLLYALGEGQVVFRDWDSLWKVLSAYRKNPASVPGFGNWCPKLKELDQFRDGRAAERMGQYIGWLAQALADGMSREQAMESARRNYVAQWGDDTVLDLRSDSGEAGRTAPKAQDYSG